MSNSNGLIFNRLARAMSPTTLVTPSPIQNAKLETFKVQQKLKTNNSFALEFSNEYRKLFLLNPSTADAIVQVKHLQHQLADHKSDIDVKLYEQYKLQLGNYLQALQPQQQSNPAKIGMFKMAASSNAAKENTQTAAHTPRNGMNNSG